MLHRPAALPRIFAALLALSPLALTGCFTTGIKKLPEAFEVSDTSLKALATATADNNAYDAANALKLFDAGVAISDRSFDEFFASFDTFQRTVAHNQTAANIAFGTAVGALGFTGATSKTLGLIGVAQAGTNAEFKNFEGVYLLSPALDVVYKKLTETRRTYAARLRADVATAKTFGQVRAMISEYHATGSLIAIRGYIRQATDIAKFEVVDADDVAATTAAQIDLAALAQAITYTTPTPTLSGVDGDIALLLHLMATQRPTYEKVKEVAGIVLKGTAAGATAPNAAARTALASQFGPLLNLSLDPVFDNVVINSRAALILGKVSRQLDFDKRVAGVVAALNTPAAGGTPAAVTPPANALKTRSIQLR